MNKEIDKNNMRNGTGILIVILLLLIQPALAQQEQQKAFTLKEAVDFAKRNNYTLQNSKLDRLSSEKKVNEILSMGLPQVNGSANLINNAVVPVQVMPNFLKSALGSGPDYLSVKFGNPFSSNVTLAVNQLIFDGTFFMGLKASKEFVNLSKLNIDRTEIETEVNVSKAYYLCLLLSINEDMMEKNIENLQKSKNDLKQVFKNGFVEKIDFDRLSLQLSNLQLQKEKIHDQKLLALMVLKLQMGMNVNSPIELTDKLADLYQKSSMETVADKIDYSKRIEYKMLQQQLSLNHLDKKRYNIGYFPSLNAFMQIQRNSFGESNFNDLYKTWYPGTMLGINLAVPVFDGFRKNAQVQQTKINISKSENDIKNFENVIEQQVFLSKTNYTRSKQQIDIQKKNYELAQEIYTKSELKYKNGVGSSLELTTAQTDLENSRTNYLATIYEFFIAELDLKKAVGNFK